jgi:hypothetical protein
MTSDFVRLTNRENGSDLFLKRSMVAAVGSYWNGKQQVTHVTLINEDIDYEVKESPREVLRLITGEKEQPNGIQEETCVAQLAGRDGTLPPVPAGRQGERCRNRRHHDARVRGGDGIASA